MSLKNEVAPIEIHYHVVNTSSLTKAAIPFIFKFMSSERKKHVRNIRSYSGSRDFNFGFFSSRSTSTSRMWLRCTSSLRQRPCHRNTEERASPLTMRSSKGRFCSRMRGDFWRPCLILCWTQSHRTGIMCADEKDAGNMIVI